MRSRPGIHHGFAREYALGNLREAPLAELAAGWRRGAYPAFRRLCRAVYQEIERDEREALTNWYERMQRAGEAKLAMVS